MLIAMQYSSDNFDKLYELAEKLIGLEKAYVCHCGGKWCCYRDSSWHFR